MIGYKYIYVTVYMSYRNCFIALELRHCRRQCSVQRQR